MDLDLMSPSDYEAWMAANGVVNMTMPSEENLIALLSAAIKATSPTEKARTFAEMADMCLHMADKTLGFQGPATKCLVLVQH